MTNENASFRHPKQNVCGKFAPPSKILIEQANPMLAYPGSDEPDLVTAASAFPIGALRSAKFSRAL
jgi:hypothetical protein